jgi:magnesium-transporting ATPase (P-type)
VCFIETKNLDGETNLKSRHALPSLSHLRSAYHCANADHQPESRFIVENQAPNADLFSYSAAIVFPELARRVPVSLQSVLLRGTVLRNTEWVIGLIVLTGPDTKVMLNSKGTPSKRSKVERQMNPMVSVFLLIISGKKIEQSMESPAYWIFFLLPFSKFYQSRHFGIHVYFQWNRHPYCRELFLQPRLILDDRFGPAG